jgi:VWFA-related protein
VYRLALSLLLLASSVPVGAQARFASRAELVVLSATAVDRKGRPVRDLRAEEFRVFEEGRPQKIRHFVGGPELPARVLLLVDASGSMNSELKTTSGRMAAHQLLDALPAEDQVALAGFDH